MAYDYQIRPGLTQSGYSDADIAYDPNRKAVTLKGKDFLTGNKLMNVAGSNFTDRGSFDTALKGYQQQEQADQTAVQNKQRIDALTNQVANTQAPTNPYTGQLDQQIKYLMDFAKTQQNVDPYSTPQYAAYQAQSGRRANEGIRASQEALGSAGFGRSTMLGQSAQGIQNQETEYLETQIIPQLLAAEESKRQQQFSNLQSLLNPVQGQQAFLANQAQTERGNARDALSMLLGEDQRGIDNTRNSQLDALNQKNTEFNQGIATAGQTGYYNPSGMNADQINQEIAKNSASYGAASPEQRQQLHARNIELNGLLGKTDSTGNGDYVGGNPNGSVGQRTVAGQAADLSNQGQTLENQLNQMKIDSYPAEAQAAAQQVQQQLQAGQLDIETAQFKLEELKDPNSPVNQAAKIDLQLKQLEAQYAEPEAKARLEQIRKATAQIGAAPYQSDMDRKLDQVRLETAQEQLSQLKTPPTPKEQTAEGYAGYVDGVARYDSQDDDGNKQLSNPVDVESAILQSNLPDSEKRKLYTRYGLKWGD